MEHQSDSKTRIIEDPGLHPVIEDPGLHPVIEHPGLHPVIEDPGLHPSMRTNSLNQDDELPSYQEHADPRSLMPTVSSPFNFPTDAPPANYTTPTTKQRPIAIPQRYPDPAAPFLPAYPPVLLSHGVPAETWYSFVDTISAFLTAKVSKRAVSHAGDVASSVVKMPQRFGRNIADNAKQHAKRISATTKEGNVPGMIGSVVGGFMGMTVGTAMSLVGHIVSTPGHAAAVAASPQTPRARAEAYATAANKGWLKKRGLQAQLLSTAELSSLVGVPVEQFLETANLKHAGVVEQLSSLGDCIESVEIWGNKPSAMAETEMSITSPGVAATELPDTSPTGYPADNKHSLRADFQEGSSSGPSVSRSRSASHNGGESSRSGDAAAPLQLSAQTLWLVLSR